MGEEAMERETITSRRHGFDDWLRQLPEPRLLDAAAQRCCAERLQEDRQ